MPRIYLSLGSNIDRRRHISLALDALAKQFGQLVYSPVFESVAVGFEGDNFYIGHKRMKDNGDGTMTIDFNCDTAHSVTVGEGWNGTFRLYKPVDVEETLAAVNHLITIDVESATDVAHPFPDVEQTKPPLRSRGKLEGGFLESLPVVGNGDQKGSFRQR